MKKHLVMLCGLYEPNASPTGRIAEAYASLLSDEYDIRVVCIRQADTPPCFDGKTVFGIDTAFVRKQERYRGKAPLRYAMAKLPEWALNRFGHPNVLRWYIAPALQMLKQLDRQRPIDLLLSVSAPMAAHCAAMRFCEEQPHTRRLALTMDSYAAQNHAENADASAARFESSVLASADYVLLSEEIYRTMPFLYTTFAEKCAALPYLLPPPLPTACERRPFPSDEIQMVYAGRFYRQLRNPEYLFSLMRALPCKAVLHLYCESDCDALVNAAVARSGGRIVRHATVDSRKIRELYAQADVLVNVGNAVPAFKPSKTFEYIAACKPILHLYYPNLPDELLSLHPAALQISMDSPLAAAADRTTRFLATARECNIRYEEIALRYPAHDRKAIAERLRQAAEEALCSKRS